MVLLDVLSDRLAAYGSEDHQRSRDVIETTGSLGRSGSSEISQQRESLSFHYATSVKMMT